MIISDSIIHDIPPVSSNKPTLSLSIYIYRMLGEQITRECRSNSHIFYREKFPDSSTLIFPSLPLFSKKRKKKKEETNIRGKDKRNRDRKEERNIFNKSRNGRREGRERNGNPLVVQESFCSARVFASGARSSVGK